MKIKSGDRVVVTVGDDKGSEPRTVLRVVDDGKKLVIEGVNRVYKHVKRGHPKSPQGGRLSKEMPVSIANVMLWCAACSKGVRVGYKVREDGSKARVCKKCQAELGEVSRAKAK